MGECTIAICTRDRPLQLLALLRSLDVAAESIGVGLDVLIVDNSSEGSISRGALNWAVPDGWTLRIVPERSSGLVSARNAALEAAPSDLPLVFLDDDEQVLPDWAAQLLTALAEYPGCLLSGAVQVTGPNGEVRQRGLPPRGVAVPHSGTGNLVLPATVLNAGRRFDHTFNDSGGEDTAFTTACVDAGWVIRSVPEMAVVEYWDEARWTPRARYQRARQSAAAYSVIHGRSVKGAARRGGSAAVAGVRGCFLMLQARIMADRDGVARAADSLGAAVGTVQGLVGRLPSR